MTGVIGLCEALLPTDKLPTRSQQFEPAPNIFVEEVVLRQPNVQALTLRSVNSQFSFTLDNKEKTTPASENQVAAVIRSWIRLGTLINLLSGRGHT